MRGTLSPHGIGLLLALCLPLHASAIDAPTAFWSGIWGQCYDVHLSGFDSRIEEFKLYLVQGRNWEERVISEKAEIDNLINGTCKAWSADPNGSEPLTAFRTEFPKVARQAHQINNKANGFLLPKLDLWTKLEEAELEGYGLFDGSPMTWDMFPCAAAFGSMQSRINARLGELRAKVDELRAKCPIASDDLAIKNTTKAYGQGSGKTVPVPGGTSPRKGSDITNTQKAIDDEKKAKAILEKK